MVDLSKVDPGSLPSKFKPLVSKEEIEEFFEKRCQVREVFGDSQLFLNPLYMQCPICGSIYSLGHFNDKVHFEDPIRSSKRGNHIVIKILSFYKFALS